MKRISIYAIFIFFNYICFAQSQFLLINLSDATKAVKDYHTSEKYYQDIEKAVDEGLSNLQQLSYPSNAAFVFDIDETALSNLEYELKFNFGFDPKTWDEWVMEGRAPAIPGVRRLYDSLIARNIKVIFISGRSSEQFEITTKNLKDQGYLKYDTLICKGLQFKGKKALEYKSTIRSELSKKYKIIGSVGDQWSDLEGGWTIIKIKLPNYMYHLD